MIPAVGKAASVIRDALSIFKRICQRHCPNLIEPDSGEKKPRTNRGFLLIFSKSRINLNPSIS